MRVLLGILALRRVWVTTDHEFRQPFLAAKNLQSSCIIVPVSSSSSHRRCYSRYYLLAVAMTFSSIPAVRNRMVKMRTGSFIEGERALSSMPEETIGKASLVAGDRIVEERPTNRMNSVNP